MKPKSISLAILLGLMSCKIFAQSSRTFEIYKNLKDTTTYLNYQFSKEEFLKLDSLIIDPKDSSWFHYTIVITGKKTDLKYRQAIGPIIKLDAQIKQWIKETDDYVLSIDEVKVLWFKEGDRRYPPVLIFIK